MTYVPIQGKCPVCHQDCANTSFKEGVVSRDAEVAELANGLDKALKCIRYMQGITERGLGRKMLDEEAPDLFMLSYMKSIEQERDQLREHVTRLQIAVETAASQIRKCDYTPARSTLLQALAATEPKK